MDMKGMRVLSWLLGLILAQVSSTDFPSCQPYQGVACAEYIDYLVYTPYESYQNEMELNATRNVIYLGSNAVSNAAPNCYDPGVQLLCGALFPKCRQSSLVDPTESYDNSTLVFAGAKPCTSLCTEVYNQCSPVLLMPTTPESIFMAEKTSECIAIALPTIYFHQVGNYTLSIECNSMKYVHTSTPPHFSDPVNTTTGNPVDIHISLQVRSLLELDSAEFRWTAQLAFSAAWQIPLLQNRIDMLLGFDPTNCGESQTMYFCRYGCCSEFWTPFPIIYQNVHESTQMVDFMIVNTPYEISGNFMGDDIPVLYHGQTHITEFSNIYDFRDFPFDSQTLEFEVVWSGFFSGHDFTLETTKPELDHLVLDGWKINDMTVTKANVELLNGAEIPSVYSGFSGQVAGVHVTISVERESLFYIVNHIVLMSFIISIQFVAFFLRTDNLEARLATSITCFLTLTTFQFSIGEDLPNVPYMTRYHKFVIFGYFIITIGAMYAVFVDRLHTSFFAARRKEFRFRREYRLKNDAVRSWKAYAHSPRGSNPNYSKWGILQSSFSKDKANSHNKPTKADILSSSPRRKVGSNTIWEENSKDYRSNISMQEMSVRRRGHNPGAGAGVGERPAHSTFDSVDLKHEDSVSQVELQSVDQMYTSQQPAARLVYSDNDSISDNLTAEERLILAKARAASADAVDSENSPFLVSSSSAAPPPPPPPPPPPAPAAIHRHDESAKVDRSSATSRKFLQLDKAELYDDKQAEEDYVVSEFEAYANEHTACGGLIRKCNHIHPDKADFLALVILPLLFFVGAVVILKGLI